MSADEMRLAIVSGMVTGEAPVSYWPIFSLSLVTVPKALRKLSRPSFLLVFSGAALGGGCMKK